MDYLMYEKQVNEIRKQNEKYLELFDQYLKREGMSKKTIQKHISNIDFYINKFLSYYEPSTMERGCYEIDSFLGDWFIRKAMWSSCSAINSNCASIKKFYKVMLEYGFIKQTDYHVLIDTIKTEKIHWLSVMEEYNDEEMNC